MFFKELFLIVSLLLLSVSPSWGGEEVPAPGLFEITRKTTHDIRSEFEKNNFIKVIDIYRNFGRQYPDTFLPTNVRVLYSQSLANVGQLEQSIAVLQTILVEYPSKMNRLRLEYDLANLLFIEKRWDEAQKVFKRILIEASESEDIVSKTKQRLTAMKEKETRNDSLQKLQMIDIESALEVGEVPEGAVEFLKQMQAKQGELPKKKSATPKEKKEAEKAGELLIRIQEMRKERGQALLDEARRLFDEGKKYREVIQVIQQLQTEYADVIDHLSVETLQQEAIKKITSANP